DAQTNMTLVRNPSYSPKTDSKAARENLPDKFVFTVDTNADDVDAKILNGDLDQNILTPTPKTLRKYATSSSLRKRLHLNSGDRPWYLTMNLTQPPFDDIHIRKAMNLIMNKQALRKAWGSPIAGDIATHIVTDALFNNEIKGFAPYKTPNESGSVAKAAA